MAVPPPVKYHAILIGINDYPTRPLKSCVRDVEETTELLKSTLDPKSQPTCKNTIAAFEQVLSLGNPGDWVYVHYSGHGTTKKPCGEFSNTTTGDLALVLLNDEGAVYRHDKPGVRCMPFTAEDQNAGATYRDASMLSNWLLNPDGYAILAACGPHQETVGVKFDGKGYGALSYYLLDTLKHAGLSRRHRDVHGRLLAKFQGSPQIQNQTPMLYGNKDQSFFGPTGSRYVAFNIPIIRWENGVLELQAGLAHGFQNGDQFILSPLALTDGPMQLRQSSVVAKITHTRGLTSDLEISKDSIKSARTGWLATALRRSGLRNLPIGLAPSIPQRDDWVSAMKAVSLDAYVDGDSHSFAFKLELHNSLGYQVLDESGKAVVNLPRMEPEETGIDQICHVINHLARFKQFEDLSNTSEVDTFTSVGVYMRYAGRDSTTGCRIEMRHAETVQLVIKNEEDTSVYVHVYDLGPFWQIEDMLGGTCCIDRGGRRVLKIKMTVPDQMRDQGCNSCEDVVKVLLTSRPTSFDMYELPKLGYPARQRKAGYFCQGGRQPPTQKNDSILRAAAVVSSPQFMGPSNDPLGRMVSSTFSDHGAEDVAIGVVSILKCSWTQRKSKPDGVSARSFSDYVPHGLNLNGNRSRGLTADEYYALRYTMDLADRESRYVVADSPVHRKCLLTVTF
ncbi:hypothetical protein LX36DRAFT_674475 [Colletotrichum falcatum]|nr:hypothetical protein LX36DRAFT_674475 [Colletotrichum falcatum]